MIDEFSEGLLILAKISKKVELTDRQFFEIWQIYLTPILVKKAKLEQEMLKKIDAE